MSACRSMNASFLFDRSGFRALRDDELHFDSVLNSLNRTVFSGRHNASPLVLQEVSSR
jgi:hypothetical protein